MRPYPYRPDHDDWKGEWRKIQVKVDRPDAMVLARSGYFALPAPQLIPAKDRYRFLDEIAASPIDSAQLLFRVHISVASKGTRREIFATVNIPQNRLQECSCPKLTANR